MSKPFFFPLTSFCGASWKWAEGVVDEGNMQDESGAQVKGDELWPNGLCR